MESVKTGGLVTRMKINTMQKEYIFTNERPFESCHASTVAALPNGDVIAAWFGGTREGDIDVDIWCSRRRDGSWSAPFKIAGQEGIPHWNPVLFYGDNNVLYLYYKVGHTIPEWYTMVMQSDDLGETWSAAKPLVKGDTGGRGPVRNKPIMLKDGSWLAPASLESEIWDAFVDISQDDGQTWTMSKLVPVRHASKPPKEGDMEKLPLTESSFQGKGIIQPTLWESEPGAVHMLLRSTEGYIFRSDSEDGGHTWSPAYSNDVPNNNSGIDLTRLKNGTLLLVYNPVNGNWAARTPLIVSSSSDNGVTWSEVLVLESEPGEYSYPAIVSQGEDVFITYTWNRERIAYWKLNVMIEENWGGSA
jgi:predicted neuraminidase